MLNDMEKWLGQTLLQLENENEAIMLVKFWVPSMQIVVAK
jgi:hypothetical protein